MSDREKAWSEYGSVVRAAVVREVPAQGEEIDLSLRLDSTTRYRFVSLTNSEYLEDDYSVFGVPVIFGVKEGSISYEDTQQVLAVTIEKDSLMGLLKTGDHGPKEFNFTVSDGNLVSVSYQGGLWSKTIVERSGDIRRLLFIEIPTGRVVQLGSKWTSPDHARVPFEVAGMFDVNGQRTVLLRAEREYDNVQMQEYARGLSLWREQQGIACDVVQAVESVRRYGISMTYLQNSYVSLASGLVFRREETYEIVATDGDLAPERTRSITQCFVV
jgi:hypothetical protein